MIDVNYLNELPKPFLKESAQFKHLFNIYNEMKAEITYVKSTVEIESKSFEGLSKSMLTQTKTFYNESITCDDLTNLNKIIQSFIYMFEQISTEQVNLEIVASPTRIYNEISEEITDYTKGSTENINALVKDLNNARTRYKTFYSKTEKLHKELEQNFMNKRKLVNDDKHSYNMTMKDRIDDKILNILNDFEDNKFSLTQSFEECKRLEVVLNELLKNIFVNNIKFVLHSIGKFQSCLEGVSEIKVSSLTTIKNDYITKALDQINSIDLELDKQEIRYNELKGIKNDFTHLLSYFNTNIEGVENSEFNLDEYFNKNNYSNSQITDNLLSYVFSFLQCLSNRKKLLNVLNKVLLEIVKNYETFISSSNKLIKNLAIPKLSTLNNCPFLIQVMDFLRSLFELAIKKYEDFNKFLVFNFTVSLDQIIKDTNSDEGIITQIFTKIQKEYNNFKTTLSKLNANKEKVTQNLDKIKENIQKTSDDVNSFTKYEKQFLSLRTEEGNINESCIETFKKYRKFLEENLEILKKTILSYKEKETVKMKELKENIISSIKIKEKNFCQILEFLEYRNQISFKNNNIFNSIKSIYTLYTKEFELNLDEKLIFDLISEIIKEDQENSPKEIQSILNDVVYINKDEIIQKKEFLLTEIISPEEENKFKEKLSYLKNNSRKISIKNFNSSRKMCDDIFYIDEDENGITNFSCALSDKILLQGKLYITNKKLVFYSWFNNSTLFGKTLIEIPKEDIVEVDRHKNLLFDNMIFVKTKTTQFLFASFINREKCYFVIREVFFGESNPANGGSQNNSEIPKKEATESQVNSLNFANLISIDESKIKSKAKSQVTSPLREIKNINESDIEEDSRSEHQKKIIKFNKFSDDLSQTQTRNLFIDDENSISFRNIENKQNIPIKLSRNISEVLSEKMFLQKLNTVNKTREDAFNLQNKRNFLSHFVKNHKFGDLPLTYFFQSLYNPNNICRELERNKNFIVSYLEERKDYGHVLTKINEENWNVKIPKYILNDDDYTLKAFLSEDNINEFINTELESSSEEFPILEFKYNYTHPILKKKFMGPSKLDVEDCFKIYFISPKCMIIEIFSYMSGFMMMDTFYSILQYKYETDYIYDEKNKKMIHDTQVNVNFGIEFVKDNWFKTKIINEALIDVEEFIRTMMIPNITKVFNNQEKIYKTKYKEILKNSTINQQVLELQEVKIRGVDIINEIGLEKQNEEPIVEPEFKNKSSPNDFGIYHEDISPKIIENPQNPIFYSHQAKPLSIHNNTDKFNNKTFLLVCFVVILVILSLIIPFNYLILIFINTIGLYMIYNKLDDVDKRIQNLEVNMKNGSK